MGSRSHVTKSCGWVREGQVRRESSSRQPALGCSRKSPTPQSKEGVTRVEASVRVQCSRAAQSHSVSLLKRRC